MRARERGEIEAERERELSGTGTRMPYVADIVPVLVRSNPT